MSTIDAMSLDRSTIARRYEERMKAPAKGPWHQFWCRLTFGHDFKDQKPQWLVHQGRAWYYGKCFKCGWHVSYSRDTHRWYTDMCRPAESDIEEYKPLHLYRPIPPTHF